MSQFLIRFVIAKLADPRVRQLAALSMLLSLASLSAGAAEIEVRVSAAGNAIGDAVVSLHAAQPQAAAAGTRAVMKQRNSQFLPRVLPVQVGSEVTFPNGDKIGHQVYSFSQAKTFELPLYAGAAATTPVLFDRPGVVVVGCNIHDPMIGYVVVLDTPYFAKSTAAGLAALQLPAGTYRLQVWHPRMSGAAHQQQVTLTAGKPLKVDVALALPEARRQLGGDRLRALQDKLRKIGP